ncbi:MAG: MFS transporter [Acetobacteraceae bacterium]
MRARSLPYVIIVAVTFLVLLIAAGVRATPGVLIIPLEREFGWSDATISGAVAVNIFLYGMIGPFAAAIMERFGLRRTVSAALLLLTVGVALTALMTRPWQLLLLWGFVVGTGSGMAAMVLGATVANRWFVRHRGLVLGLLTASSATGQLVFLPFLASLAENFGWRAVCRSQWRGLRSAWCRSPHSSCGTGHSMSACRPSVGSRWCLRPLARRTRRSARCSLCATGCGRAISGCSPAASSSAAPPPTA